VFSVVAIPPATNPAINPFNHPSYLFFGLPKNLLKLGKIAKYAPFHIAFLQF